MHISTFSEWLCFFAAAFPVTEAWAREPLRRKCSAAASACSSGTLCTHIKTSLQECVHGSAFKTGQYCLRWNGLVCETHPHQHTHVAAFICSYLVTRWEDSRIIPSSPIWISTSALDLTPEKKMINSLRNVLAPELNLLLILTLHVSYTKK